MNLFKRYILIFTTHQKEMKLISFFSRKVTQTERGVKYKDLISSTDL